MCTDPLFIYPQTMDVQKQRRRRMPEYQRTLSGYEHAAVEKFSEHAAKLYVLNGNYVSTSFPPHSSCRKQIEMIAAHALVPIPIRSISSSPRADGTWNLRSRVIFGLASNYINLIAGTIGMRWWITDGGLNVDFIMAESNLSDFTALAGKLMADQFTTRGRLEKEDLLAIALALDERKFPLLMNLPLSLRKKLAEFNITHPKLAVKTFQQAIGHRSIGRRAVQRTLYSARDKFLRSQADPRRERRAAGVSSGMFS